MPTTGRIIAGAAALTVVVGASAWIAGPVSARQLADTRAAAPADRVISAFNDCIQKRFRDVNDRFGMARVIKMGDTAHRFQPENVREMDAVRGLEQTNLRVVLYLAGRGVLRAMPGPEYWGEDHGWGIIKGPVQITSGRAGRSSTREEIPPRPRDLWDESQRAMLAFAANESYEFVNSGWTFIARPVRAVEENCLKCHARREVRPAIPSFGDKSLQIGDPLGAVLYGYRPVR